MVHWKGSSPGIFQDTVQNLVGGTEEKHKYTNQLSFYVFNVKLQILFEVCYTL